MRIVPRRSAVLRGVPPAAKSLPRTTHRSRNAYASERTSVRRFRSRFGRDRRDDAGLLPFDSKQVCVAIEVVIAWGPEMRRSPHERVAERLPELSTEAIATLVAEAKRIESEA